MLQQKEIEGIMSTAQWYMYIGSNSINVIILFLSQKMIKSSSIYYRTVKLDSLMAILFTIFMNHSDPNLMVQSDGVLLFNAQDRFENILIFSLLLGFFAYFKFRIAQNSYYKHMFFTKRCIREQFDWLYDTLPIVYGIIWGAVFAVMCKFRKAADSDTPNRFLEHHKIEVPFLFFKAFEFNNSISSIFFLIFGFCMLLSCIVTLVCTISVFYHAVEGNNDRAKDKTELSPPLLRRYEKLRNLIADTVLPGLMWYVPSFLLFFSIMYKHENQTSGSSKFSLLCFTSNIYPTISCICLLTENPDHWTNFMNWVKGRPSKVAPAIPNVEDI